MARRKVLLTRRRPHAVERHLLERYDVTLNERDVPLTGTALREAMRIQDALCPTVTDSIGAELFAPGDMSARIVGNFGVGINHIDVAAAHRAGVIVTNTPDVLTDATADLAVLLMDACFAGRPAPDAVEHA